MLAQSGASRSVAAIPLPGEAEYPLVSDDMWARFRHVVVMQELMTAIPDLGWLMSPVGLAVFVGLLLLVMSGLVGRIVLYVDNLVNSFDLDEPVATEPAREDS
jgi:hypothetical protein